MAFKVGDDVVIRAGYGGKGGMAGQDFKRFSNDTPAVVTDVAGGFIYVRPEGSPYKWKMQTQALVEGTPVKDGAIASTVSCHGARDRSAAFDALGTALRSYAKDGRATDGAASYGFATLLAVLLAWYHAQHQSPQDYDLTTYQPARKTFDAVDLKIGDKVTCYAEHPHGVGKVIRMTVNDAIVEWTTPPSKILPYGHINTEAWPKSDWGLLTKI